MIEQFKKDLEIGLSSEQKYISSKYFYDQKGDELFVQIMNLPEYYLTRSEHEIFKTQSNKIIETFISNQQNKFELIELGPGDGIKTKELLKELVTRKASFDYLPVDISISALESLEQYLITEFPNITIRKHHGDYFHVLHSMSSNKLPKVVLFLGSNIGNYSDEQAKAFFKHLSDDFNRGDKLLLGVDLIKSADIVLPAYNDSKGITREFNLNLLRRINHELDGNFNLDYFVHSPEYSESIGIARSFIESTIDQTVSIRSIGKDFSFTKGEKIFTEISRKYNDEILDKLLEDSGMRIVEKFTDSKKYFTDYLIEKDLKKTPIQKK